MAIDGPGSANAGLQARQPKTEPRGALVTTQVHPKIRIRGLRKAFGNNQVLDGVDLVVMPGTALVIIGESGSGKSVLLRCILGLETPDAGIIEIDGIDVLTAGDATAARLRHQIGVLFQNGALFDSLPVWENVIFGLLAEGRIQRGEGRTQAIRVLAQVGLAADVADLNPGELSGGMQKRVALARAIAPGPAIMFFDEPTTGLDPIMAAIIDRLIVKCVKSLGSTSIAITHDMASARVIGDAAAMLYQGRIIWTGSASDLMTSGNADVEQFTHGLTSGPIKLALTR